MPKLFPKSVNRLPLQMTLYLVVLVCIATAGVTYYMTPKYTRVGYAPIQPVPYSHAKHVGELGLDCRYCHSYDRHGGFVDPDGPDLHELPQPDQDGEPRAGGGPRQLPDRKARPVGPRPRAARASSTSTTRST